MRDPAQPSPSPRHKRRHSELPTRTRSQEEERAEELARGALLFRSPVVFASPRSPSPASLSRRHSHSQRQASPSRGQQSPLARRSSIKSQARAASPCPTTRRAQQQSHCPSIARQRPPHPLPLGPESHCHSVIMTPHEQVLRARLERVLQSGKLMGSPKLYEEWKREDSSPIADDERDSVCDDDYDDEEDEDENVVRDENGARPWRDQRHRAAQKTTLAMASPASGSGSARSMSKERSHHYRSRSRTEPILPALHYPATPDPPSPKRCSTAPNGVSVRRNGGQRHPGRSGTTPPLVSDWSPTPPEDESEDPEDTRLLTPPATPPSRSGAYGYPTAYGKEYLPSPYYTKASLGPLPSASPTNDRRGRTVLGRGQPSKQQLYNRDGQEVDEESEFGSGSSYFESCSCSGACQHRRYPHPHQQLPTLPDYPPQHLSRQQQQQFNVRRASAKCREMEGYVSFAAVEGLGAPPESESGEEDHERKMKLKDAKGGVVGGWVRKLWGSEGVVV